jgi:hypothetical protein
MADVFPILILNARPAAGKSEIIQYLKEVPLQKRVDRFHIGSMKILDDFPLLWTWFEEDNLLQHEFGYPRLRTTADNYFIEQVYWHLLICRLSQSYEKWLRDAPEDGTAVIEFSRGSEHGGYQQAYKHLSDKVLKRAATLYIRVSFEESFRKNKERYNPARPDSILQHSLEDEKLRKLYFNDDWFDFSSRDPNYLSVRNFQIPYVVFENEDDITTKRGKELASRLEAHLQDLWSLWEKRH